MSKVRFGILSTAGIAQKQLIPAIQRASNAEVTAISSSSGIEKAKEVAEKFDIEKAYGSYEELLNDPTIDAVYIPLPNHLHKKWVCEAAKKGKHILCEKPLALTEAEVEEMRQVCEEHQVLLMEAFMYYFHPQHERVREIIASGEIGDVKFMRAGFSFYLQERQGNIRMDADKGGGSIYDVGCYAIHAIRNILGQEPERVHVHGIIDPTYEVDTDAVGYLTFANGVHAVFDSSFNYADRQEYEVIGTEGKIVVPRAYRPDKHGGDGLVIVEKAGVTRTETIQADQYRMEVEHLAAAILNGERELTLSLDNTIQNMRVIDASYESMKTGKTVEIPQ